MVTRTRLGLLAAVLGMGLLSPARPATAGELVREAVMLALADEEPPPGRSQLIEKMRKEEEAKAAAQKKQEIDDTPAYKKWWFWALTAAVVGGTVALGVWAVEPSKTLPRACTPGSVGCFGEGRR